MSETSAPPPVHRPPPAAVFAPADRPAPPGDTEARDFEPQQVMVFTPDMDSARWMEARLGALGYRILRRRPLLQINLVLNVLRLPEGVSVEQALERLSRMDREWIVDANHRYRGATDQTLHQPVHQLIGWDLVTPGCGEGFRLGVVDTSIDTGHPALVGADIVSRSLLPLGVSAAAPGHATAIASILVGQGGSGQAPSGLLPGARLYSAGVFLRRSDGLVDTNAELIIAALDWLQGERVSVVNLSLTGSANRLLQRTIQALQQQQLLMAAAAGNAGPDAPPAYPAAWPEVVAVTAVDLDARIYRHANQGAYIDVAAPGVDVWAAQAGAAMAYYSGTSYAVPYATAALALIHRRGGSQSDAMDLIEQLRQQTQDLGAPGPDPIFGHGLIQTRGGCGQEKN